MCLGTPAAITNPFKLDQVAPWGRSRRQYAAFFGLADVIPGSRILDCAAGPSSFNAEMTPSSYRVVSADPLYALPKAEIARRIEGARAVMLAGLRAARDRFVWTNAGTPEESVDANMAAMGTFLGDFEAGLDDQRYVAAALPDLPFADRAFELVLCSHFLFLYSAVLDTAFHCAALRAMGRVGREVRVFPLLDLDGRPSCHREPVIRTLSSEGYDVQVRPVAYEFQKGGNEMLVLRRG